MTGKTRNPSQPPEPESQEPRGPQAQKPGAPGDSFYLSALGSHTRKKLIEAHNVKNLDWEIALLRLRLRRLLVQEQLSVNAKDKKSQSQRRKCETRILKAIELLIRACSARMRASGDSADPDGKAIENILREAADTVGLERIPWPSNC